VEKKYVSYEKMVKKTILKEIQFQWGQLESDKKDFSLELTAMKCSNDDDERPVLVYGSNFFYKEKPYEPDETKILRDKENGDIYTLCEVRKGYRNNQNNDNNGRNNNN
jgi:hypothetical protein